MKIRKAFQGTVPENKILDTYSQSQTDTYSCNYVNGVSLDMFRFRKYIKNITVGANGMTTTNMGSVNAPDGYTYLGCIANNNGYGDQWVVSYAEYGGSIYAMIHSKWGASLSSNITCYAIYINNNVKDTMIL